MVFAQVVELDYFVPSRSGAEFGETVVGQTAVGA